MKKTFFIGVSHSAMGADDGHDTMCAVNLMTKSVHRFDNYRKISEFVTEHFNHDAKRLQSGVTFELPLDLIHEKGLEEFSPGRRDLFNFCAKNLIDAHEEMRRIVFPRRHQRQGIDFAQQQAA